MTTPGQDGDLAQLQTWVAELQAILRDERARAEAERVRAEAERATSKQRIAALEKERDNLRSSHERLRHELELFKRRLFIAKAERSNDAGQLELEFAQKLRELDALAGTLGIANDRPESDDRPARDGKPRGKRTNNRGTGRRDMKELGLEQERIEIPDPRLEALVAQGKVERHALEETFKLMNRRATKVLLVVARVRYKTVDAEGNTDVITTVMPNEMLPGSMAAPSFASSIIMENVGKGMPLFPSRSRSRATASASTVARWRAGRSWSATASLRPWSRRCTDMRSAPRSASRRMPPACAYRTCTARRKGGNPRRRVTSS